MCILYLDQRLRSSVNFLTVSFRVSCTHISIISGTMEELLTKDFGGPLHSFVVPGEVHFIEKQMLDYHHWDKERKMQEGRDQMYDFILFLLTLI